VYSKLVYNNRMRIGMYAVLALLIVLPFATRAQTAAELQAQLDALLAQVAALQQLQTMLPTASVSAAMPAPALTQTACPSFTRILQKGMEGSDVMALQTFLKNKGFLAVEPTGYFGALTEKALQDFQASEGIVSSGSPAATGWGVAGPKTRAAITALCASSPVAPTPNAPKTCPAAPASPLGVCATAWLQVGDEQGCHVAWQCAKDETLKLGGPPKIERIDGPLQLFIGEKGTWNVTALDPDGSALVYSVTWGDEGTTNLLELLAGYSAPAFSPSPSLFHSFLRAGIFSPTITVRDVGGETTTGSLSITVVPKPASTSPAAIFNPGPNACAFNTVRYPEGTETEGYNINDLCLQTGGLCAQRGAYVPKFKCTLGAWQPVLTNPYPNLPTYANTVGSYCQSDGAFRQVVVEPGTQLCRGLLCAVAKTYAPIQVRCQYVNWVDWGAFSAGATTTTVCAEPTPCEYVFGTDGRACAAKEYGVCKAAPYQNAPPSF
jgi:peptidoglycan hydrolase-like protein with peptidoglycan-binding domain